METFPSLHVCTHPVIADRLTRMRDKTTPPALFRACLQDITRLMAYPLLADLPATTRPIETPLAAITAPCLAAPAPSLVAILRAGLGMTEPLRDVLPEASVGHIGLYRDHDTFMPHTYYQNLPHNAGQTYILCDPMLATGNSAVDAANKLVAAGIRPEQLKLLVLVAAPKGVATFATAFPMVPIFAAALDETLNDRAYIVPGLGDAGDRIFATL